MPRVCKQYVKHCGLSRLNVWLFYYYVGDEAVLDKIDQIPYRDILLTNILCE